MQEQNNYQSWQHYVAAANDAGREDCADLKKIKCGASVRVVVGSDDDSD